MHKVRQLKTSNAREFWSIINCKKPNKILSNISLEVLQEHFKKLNEGPSDQTDTTPFNQDSTNSLFNDSFTTDDVSRMIRTLKNNKSCGMDQIINEYLKNCPPKCILLFTELFNVILDSGLFPEQWSVGIIKPLYKKSGDRDSPDSYCGITILSCLGKLFSNLLNDRLTQFVNKNDIIGPEQAGFRSGFSTTDHMFCLKALIDIYFSKKKKTILLLY